jgi:hypothetical protein
MLEFELTLKEYDKYLKSSKKSFNKGWSGFHNAEEQYNRATRLREELLQNKLKEGGLAVCSTFHDIEESENMENLSAEQLVIYPREQMRLHYYVYGPYTTQGEYEDYTNMDRRLRLLCPKHFPKKSEWFYKREEGLYTHTHIDSEVINKDGKFILVVNASDITKDITELIRKGGLDISPDGLKPYLIDKAVFRYFGIPDLPEKPDIDSVRHQ